MKKHLNNPPKTYELKKTHSPDKSGILSENFSVYNATNADTTAAFVDNESIKIVY